MNYMRYLTLHSSPSHSVSVCLPLAAGALITHRCVEILKLIAHISRHTTLNRHLYIALSLSGRYYKHMSYQLKFKHLSITYTHK